MTVRQRLECTETSLECAVAAVTLAAQVIAIIVLYKHFGPEIREAWAEVQAKAREVYQSLSPEPLAGKLWDDVAEAMQHGLD